jgi:hypothetical protein
MALICAVILAAILALLLRPLAVANPHKPA